jgi:hypothetical protein
MLQRTGLTPSLTSPGSVGPLRITFDVSGTPAESVAVTNRCSSKLVPPAGIRGNHTVTPLRRESVAITVWPHARLGSMKTNVSGWPVKVYVDSATHPGLWAVTSAATACPLSGASPIRRATVTEARLAWCRERGTLILRSRVCDMFACAFVDRDPLSEANDTASRRSPSRAQTTQIQSSRDPRTSRAPSIPGHIVVPCLKHSIHNRANNAPLNVDYLQSCHPGTGKVEGERNLSSWGVWGRRAHVEHESVPFGNDASGGPRGMPSFGPHRPGSDRALYLLSAPREGLLLAARPIVLEQPPDLFRRRALHRVCDFNPAVPRRSNW